MSDLNNITILLSNNHHSIVITGVMLTECVNCQKKRGRFKHFSNILKRFSYLITSEYFSISDNDNLPSGIDAHLPLQLRKVFCATVVHIHQVPLEHNTRGDEASDACFNYDCLCARARLFTSGCPLAENALYGGTILEISS